MDIVSTKLMGGLGNLMFQVATAYCISLRDNKELICDTNDMIIPHKPYQYYTENIFRKIKFSDKIFNLVPFTENGFEYKPIPKFGGNVKLYGYFQNEKYFLNFKKEVFDLFEIDESTELYLKRKYEDIINQETCSLHVRRGDYVNLPNAHPVQPIDYYKNAIKIIGEDKYFLIFSDDINWCKENLDFIQNKIFISDNLDYQDLYLMSMCKNNITANSTFSWWGAWLNKNENKQVVLPKKWFGVAYSNYNTDDLYCDKWIKI